MLDAIFSGFGTGIVLSLMLGTVFFALIQNSVNFGYKSGIFIALGVIISDVFFISAAILGTSFLPDVPKMPFYSSLVGGFLLISLGIASIFKKKSKIVYPKTKFGNLMYYFSTGFLLNVLNPVNFFYWVAIVAYLQTEKFFLLPKQIIFFSSCLSAIFITEVAISYFASRLRNFFTPLVLRRINQVSGLIFVGFGIKLLYDAITIY
jgi:threonine/homoserine/homoserine lactone efflux protein